MRSPTFDGYIRVSRVNGRSGDSYRSPGDQRAVIERLALAHGLKLGEIVTEEDVSGSKKAAQRELGRLVEKIEAGQSMGLIVWKVSRFSRSLLDGVTTASRISVAGGRLLGEDLDTSAPMGKALLGLMLGLAEEELDGRREGWRRAIDGAIQRGIYIGTTPVGFTKQKDQTLRRNADAKVIREVFLARINGRSWNNLGADLEAAGVKTATGKREWHINSVRSLIEHPVYKGTLVNGHEHHFARYAIVTAAEWDAAQPSKGKGNHDHAERGKWALLSSFAICLGCGHALAPGETHKGGRSYRYYRCQYRPCTAHARVSADVLDAWVSNAVLETLRFFSERIEDEVKTGRDLDVGVVAGLESAVEEAKERRRKAVLALDVDDPKDAAALEILAIEVETAKAELTEALGSSSRGVSASEWEEGWPTWGLDERRRVLRELRVRVTVAAGNKVPEGVTLELGDGSDSTSVTLGSA